MPQVPDPGPGAAPPLLPTLLIAGWLGSGKTTLVNHLLRQCGGRRVAVLVNDFGQVGIDAELIVGSSAGVLSLAGGCLCCSFGDDLVGTLRGLADRDPRPEFVLVELSGVALPGAVLRTVRLVPQVAPLGALVLADASAVRGLASAPYIADTVREQLAAAHWLLPSKTDLFDPAEARALQEWLAGIAPRARLLPGPAAQLPAELVYGWSDEAPGAVGDAHARAFEPRPLRPPHPRFASRTVALPAGTDLGALASRLAQPRLGVLRAKAIVDDAAGASWLLQWTPGLTHIEPCAVRGHNHLVVIGLHEAIAGWPEGALA